MAILLNNVSSNTTSERFKGVGRSHIVIIRADDFGGGTIDVKVSSANDPFGRFSTLVDGSFTESGQYKIDYMPAGHFIMAELTGSTSPVNVFVDIEGVVEVPPAPAPIIPLPPLSDFIDTWFDASKEETITSSGGLVSAFADPRGNSRIVTQANDSFKPETGILTKNGLNVLSFGLNDQLTLDMSPTLSNEEVSVFAAVRDSVGGTSFRYYFDMFQNSSGVGIGFALFDVPAEQGIIRDANPSAAQIAANGGNGGDWNIAGGTRSSSDSHRLNARINANEATGLRSSPVDVIMDRMTVGQGRLELVNSVTEVAEIIVYSKALNLSERNTVVQYMSDKWAIT